MTHTVTDAEAAIARHSDDLMQLSMAADLLIELDDPRGEDFAACLAGVITAEEVMRRHPADVSAMFVAAWAMTQNALGYHCPGPPKCNQCSRAEALRLLAECGRVGEEGFGYDITTSGAVGPQVIPVDWYDPAFRARQFDFWWQVIPERLRLIDAYAQADPDTRRRWTEETRALTP